MHALGVFYSTLKAGATYIDRHVPRAFFFQGEALGDGNIDTVILLKLDEKVRIGENH